MFLSLLSTSPALAIVWVLAIVIALTFHEFSHALIGDKLGDPTAEREGRLTLNPLAHLDPLGFFMLLLAGFGWAKPVPFNPYNLKDPKMDALKIALAGPISNLLLAIVSALVLRGLLSAHVIEFSSLLTAFLLLLTLVNLFLMVFNLIPVHPLDGSKMIDALLVHTRYEYIARWLAQYGPRMLFIAVLVSLFTSIDVFFFVSAPGFALCDAVVGYPCGGLLGQIFGGL